MCGYVNNKIFIFISLSITLHTNVLQFLQKCITFYKKAQLFSILIITSFC